MDINDRVKFLRESLGLSQEAFGKKISLERSTISLIERHQRKATDRVIADICREFIVNEEWLREGIGEMFKEPENTFSLEEYLNQKNCTEKDIALIKAFTNAYMQFPEELRDSFIDNLISEYKNIKQLSDTAVHDVEFIEESKEK